MATVLYQEITELWIIKLLCVVINVLTYVNQNRNHLAVLDFST